MKAAKAAKREHSARTARTTRGRNQDRRKVAAGQGYEVNYFATKHGLTREQARELISRIGNDRTKLNAAAERLSKRAR
jgi:hypothetical protein